MICKKHNKNRNAFYGFGDTTENKTSASVITEGNVML